VEAIKSLPPADGTAKLLVPGEGGRRTGADRAATGIPVGPKVWRDLTEVAATLDVPVPAPQG
jgi:ureidoglycolate dehydrogenase (NAD+)